MATEAIEEKKVSKLDRVLNKIDAFFDSLMSSKKEDEEPDDADDEKDEAKKAKKADDDMEASKKATDEEDSQDPDDDDDDEDEDEDPDKDEDDDVYGKKAKAEIAGLKATIEKQNALLKEAKSALQEKDETIRESIKSTFKPQGSQRSSKSVAKTEAPSFAQPQSDLAKRAAALAAKQKR